METSNGTETWYMSLHAVLKALNTTLHSHLLCRPGPGPGPDNQTEDRRASLPGRNDNSYMYILFVMFLFAVTVGSLILGYTRSRKVDKRSDPYHVYIKNRVSMIWCEEPEDNGRLQCLRIVFWCLRNSTQPYQATVYLCKINRKLVRGLGHY
jgi:potassium voltage-gated channel Isk-related subfamily E protein 3